MRHVQNERVFVEILPQDGMRVVVRGYVSIFEKAGQYQLYATEIIQDGAGELHMAFERLKKELQEKGMFDNSHKKQLPFLPSTVCVVTSSTGAVIRDIINVMSRRFPNVHIRLVPTAVQGPDAPGEISGPSGLSTRKTWRCDNSCKGRVPSRSYGLLTKGLWPRASSNRSYR